MNKNLLFASLGVVAPLSIAFADGVLPTPAVANGQFGANRRVITLDAPDYTAVRGNFTLPTIRIPSFSYRGNIYRSKPTFYLGCSTEGYYDDEFDYVAGVEVDAGFQYESEPIRITGGVTAPAGWSILVRTTGAATTIGGQTQNPAYATGGLGWRCGPGTPNSGVASVDMMWTVYQLTPAQGGGYGGYLVANVAGAGQFVQPVDRDFNDNKIRARSAPSTYRIVQTTAGMAIKRVVGMTQGKDQFNLLFPIQTGGGLYQEDGSYLRGCSFTNGQVSPQSPPSTGWNYFPTQWLTWDASRTLNDDQTGSTGFYPGGRDKSVLSYQTTPPYEGIIPAEGTGPVVVVKGHANSSRPIFEFPNLPQSEWENEVSSRYATETINVNLRNFFPVGGRTVTIGGVTPNVQ